MYLTALAEPDGQTHFYRDVYKRDAALLKALNDKLVIDVPVRDAGAQPNG
jgi:murein L,D-transpeptidase YcbB/YkuD